MLSILHLAQDWEGYSMSELVDKTSVVRKGEELDQSKLEPYLRETLDLPDGDFRIEQFPGGHSNLTYLVVIGDTEMVLRRPPFGSTVKSAHDMSREYRVTKALSPVYAPAPKPLLFCDDHDIMGADFYAMERIRGLVLRKDKPEGLELNEAQVRASCVAMAENLADLHANDWKAVGLESLQKKDGSFMRRQVEGWAKRYEGSKTHDLPQVDEVLKWCIDRIPEDSGAVVIHNDYKFDNVIVDTEDISKIIGVLDWEMSTIGDPLFDLGCALSYWTNPDEPEGLSTTNCFIQSLPGSITREEFVQIYSARAGRDVTNMNYQLVFQIIKLAVVLQQIYYRYHHGKTTDERFAGLGEAVKLLAMRAGVFIESGGI
jgi:aminoglycoside phosphotransferase (APT) family kinase protein